MSQSRTSVTPLLASIQFHPTNDNNKLEHPELYQAAIGSLMYATIRTQPDITYTIQTLSQFSHNPSNEHWHVVKHLLCYLQGTKDMGLHMINAGEAPLSLSPVFWMQIGRQTKLIRNQFPDIPFYSVEEQYHGLLKSSPLWLCHQWKWSTLPQP
jgi:hypothetical protein